MKTPNAQKQERVPQQAEARQGMTVPKAQDGSGGAGASTADIEELPIPISHRHHLTLKAGIALCLGLIGSTYTIVHFIQIEPLNRKLEDAKALADSHDTERNALGSRLTKIQSQYDELTRSMTRPALIFPPDRASLLGGAITFEWDYAHHALGNGYVIELRNISELNANAKLIEVSRPESKRLFYDLGTTAFGEFLWRIRPGKMIAGQLAPLGEWSLPHSYVMNPNVISRVTKTARLLVASTPTSYDDLNATGASGGYQGFEVDLIRWIATQVGEKLGLKQALQIEFVQVPWNRLFQAVENGEVDIAIRSISKSAQREKEFRNIKFSSGYIQNHQVIIQRSRAGEFPAALDGAAIGVKASSVNERAARYLIPGLKWRVDPSFTNYGDIYQALQDGKIEFALVDSVLAEKFTRTRFVQLGPPLDELLRPFYETELGSAREEYAIAFHEAGVENALRTIIDESLASPVGKQKLAELRSQYGL